MHLFGCWQVSVLDIDICGPSIPRVMGAEGQQVGCLYPDITSIRLFITVQPFVVCWNDDLSPMIVRIFRALQSLTFMQYAFLKGNRAYCNNYYCKLSPGTIFSKFLKILFFYSVLKMCVFFQVHQSSSGWSPVVMCDLFQSVLILTVLIASVYVTVINSNVCCKGFLLLTV